ncbi:MAG: hypothetical protein RQ833_06265 [Sphingomonadaceae bacterium]|nr:hypothetical protein [Sphingomonadaceae bacterium]
MAEPANGARDISTFLIRLSARDGGQTLGYVVASKSDYVDAADAGQLRDILGGRSVDELFANPALMGGAAATIKCDALPIAPGADGSRGGLVSGPGDGSRDGLVSGTNDDSSRDELVSGTSDDSRDGLVSGTFEASVNMSFTVPGKGTTSSHKKGK